MTHGDREMSSISSIALSGMNAAQTALNAAANNVANSNTPGFRRDQVQQSQQADDGVTTSVSKASADGAALVDDLVAQLQAKNAFLANLQVFKTSNKTFGALLDTSA